MRREVVSGTIEAVQAPERGRASEDDEEGYDHSQFDDEEATRKVVRPRSRRLDRAVVRPFAELPPLPADVNDAFEAYKLCILRTSWPAGRRSPATTCWPASTRCKMLPSPESD